MLKVSQIFAFDQVFFTQNVKLVLRCFCLQVCLKPASRQMEPHFSSKSAFNSPERTVACATRSNP